MKAHLKATATMALALTWIYCAGTWPGNLLATVFVWTPIVLLGVTIIVGLLWNLYANLVELFE